MSISFAALPARNSGGLAAAHAVVTTAEELADEGRFVTVPAISERLDDRTTSNVRKWVRRLRDAGVLEQCAHTGRAPAYRVVENGGEP